MQFYAIIEILQIAIDIDILYMYIMQNVSTFVKKKTKASTKVPASLFNHQIMELKNIFQQYQEVR